MAEELFFYKFSAIPSCAQMTGTKIRGFISAKSVWYNSH